MEFPLQPLTSHLIVKRIDSEWETTRGIIYRADKPRRGLVIAVGPGTMLDSGEREPMELEPGDVAVYPKNYGTEITIGGVELTFLRAADVLAKETAA
jgi:chaperonin GroES